MKHNLAGVVMFAEAVKVMNNPGLWDAAELISYSLSATYLNGLEIGLGIQSFLPIWYYLIFEVLATWAKFLKPSGYCPVINCTISFHTTYIFGCFMAQFKIVKYKFQN